MRFYRRIGLVLLASVCGLQLASAQSLLDRARRRIEGDRATRNANQANAEDAEARGANDVLFAVSLADNAGAFELADRNKNALSTVTKELGKTLGSMRDLSWSGLARAATERAVVKGAEQLTPQNRLRNNVALGEGFYRGRRFRTAAQLFTNALSVGTENAELQADRAFARAVAGLGLTHMGLGRYATADSLLRRAALLQDSLQGDTSLAAVAARSNLAVLHRELGRYTDAETLSAKLVTQTDGWSGVRAQPQAIVRNNHAMLLAALGRDAESEALLRRAIEPLEDRDLLAVQLLSNLALVTQNQGRYASADSLYNVALARQRRRLGAGNHPDMARLLNSQAALHLAMGKTDDVEKLLTEALEIYKNRFGEQHPAVASTLHNLGTFHLVQKNFTAAEPALTQAQTIRQAVLGPQHPELAATQDALAVLYWNTQRADKATELFRQLNQLRLAQVQRFFPAMSETEKARFWSRIQPGLERFANYAIAQGKTDATLLADLYNLQLATKALLLNQGSQLRKRIETSGDAALRAQYRAWTDATTQLALAYSRPKAELADEGTNLDSLERAANQLERDLSAAAEKFGGLGTATVTLAQVRSALKPNQVAVELIRVRTFDLKFTGKHSYAALVIAPGDGPVKLAVAPDGQALEATLLTRYRRAIRNKQPVEAAVYQGYWGWIAPEVGAARDVYLSLDGVYHQISLATLQSGANTPYLLQQKVLHTLVSTRDLPSLAPATKPAGAAQAVLIGNPDFAAKLELTSERSGIAPLPGTAVEISKLTTLLTPKGYKITSFLKERATEKNLKLARKPRVLHVATHGYFLSDVDASGDEKLVFGVQPDKALVNPMLRSGLLLTGADWTVQNLKRPEGETGEDDNGILTAFEALNLDLQGTELVVLSACETGLGDVQAGEGVYGLQRAFQLAGAKALVISLWRVDDAATQQLMTKFYTYWLAGKPLKDAFQQAQLDLRATFPQPYFWGAFQLIGA